MWDESLPAYTGSFEDNIILCMIYLRYGLFYAIMFLGIIFIMISLVSPFVIAYFSISSIRIKIKSNKNNKLEKRLQGEENLYLNRLENKLQKKKKK